MSEETVRIIVVALLGAGGATFIGTLFKSIIAWRENHQQRDVSIQSGATRQTEGGAQPA